MKIISTCNPQQPPHKVNERTAVPVWPFVWALVAFNTSEISTFSIGVTLNSPQKRVNQQTAVPV